MKLPLDIVGIKKDLKSLISKIEALMVNIREIIKHIYRINLQYFLNFIYFLL